MSSFVHNCRCQIISREFALFLSLPYASSDQVQRLDGFWMESRTRAGYHVGLVCVAPPGERGSSAYDYDRTLIDFRQFVIASMGKSRAVSTQLNAAVRIFIDFDGLVDKL